MPSAECLLVFGPFLALVAFMTVAFFFAEVI